MRFEEFYAERSKVVREADDVAAFRTGVERLRALVLTVDDDPAKAQRYLEATERLLLEATTPGSAAVDHAFDVLLQARRLPDGAPAEQRAHVEAGIAEIARIAAAAPTDEERDAALDMNATLLRVLERIASR
ncbi:hypothetical protein [Kribbella speibonae]|uniref:Uncharacterized protein n=1 Tax=Kribbella speibonae TaxID=1572660 RepID=A0A4R0IRB8_9ACTN|nr:hypothetical protein [Kribbella speibonae]TCC35607.1 hypothetical protein E0H92_23025 [Kribbella speibonae]